jgi:hypothetical protein
VTVPQSPQDVPAPPSLVRPAAPHLTGCACNREGNPADAPVAATSAHPVSTTPARRVLVVAAHAVDVAEEAGIVLSSVNAFFLAGGPSITMVATGGGGAALAFELGAARRVAYAGALTMIEAFYGVWGGVDVCIQHTIPTPA